MKTVKIKTKRDKGPWRGTAIRALIDNPIYIGHMHMGEALSPKFENLQIIDDDLFARCQEVVKGRATILKKDMSIPERTDTGSMLSGIRSCPAPSASRVSARRCLSFLWWALRTSSIFM